MASRLKLTFGDHGLFSIQATAVARVPWYNLDRSNTVLALAVAWPMVVGGCMYNDAGSVACELWLISGDGRVVRNALLEVMGQMVSVAWLLQRRRMRWLSW